MRNFPPRKLINLSTAGQKKEGGMGQVANRPNFPPFFQPNPKLSYVYYCVGHY